MKDHTIKKLIEALWKAGVLIKSQYTTYRSARNHVQYWIKQGKLQLRQSNRNNYYLVSDTEIKEIVRALKHTGAGFYHAKI